MANTPLGVVTVDDVLSAKEVATPPPAPAQSKPSSPKKALTPQEMLLEGVRANQDEIARILGEMTSSNPMEATADQSHGRET